MGIAVWDNDVRVAAWSDGTNVYSQRFDPKGNPVGDQLQVGTLGTFSGVAALASGAYLVEYQRPDAVLVQVVTPAGALAGPPITVRTQAQVTADLPTNPTFPSEAASLAGGNGVTAFPDGSFAAEYTIYQPSHIPGSYPYGLFAQKYDALGHAVGTPVGFGNGLTASWASTAPIAAGGLLVADILACPCSGSGAPAATVYDQNLQSEHVRFGGAPGNNASASAAALSGGNYVAVWTAAPDATSNASQVQGQVFAADPTSVSGVRNVTAPIIFQGAAPGARVAALAGGGFLLSWHGAAQAFDANGQALSPVLQTIDGTVATTPDGGFVVLAQIGSQLVAQQYSIVH